MPTAVFEKHIQELNFSFISDRGTSGVLLTANYVNIPGKVHHPFRMKVHQCKGSIIYAAAPLDFQS